MEPIIEKIKQTHSLLKSQKRESESINMLKNICIECMDLLGWCYMDNNDPQTAEKIAMASLMIDPSNWITHSQMCNVKSRLGDIQEGLNYAKKALNYCTVSYPEIVFNAAVLSHDLGKHTEAEILYRTCLQIDPNYNIAKFNLGCSLLIQNKYSQGWPLYEKRFETREAMKNFRKPYDVAPVWQGENIDGKNLLVFNEQGMGDLIQNVRFLHELKEMGAKIHLCINNALIELFKKSKISHESMFGYISEIPKNIDYIVSVNSIPSILNKEYNSDLYLKKYITVKNKTKLSNPGKFNVGLVTCGTHSHPYDWRRSLKNSDFLDLVNTPDVKFYNLTKVDKRIRKKLTKFIDITDVELPIDNVSEQLNTFLDTASFINSLDLVVTVDTSVAHLAGAMGKPTWIILDYSNDWRWGSISETTFWYPSMRLFRQSYGEEMRVVVDRLKEELIKLIKS